MFTGDRYNKTCRVKLCWDEEKLAPDTTNYNDKHLQQKMNIKQKKLIFLKIFHKLGFDY